ARNYTKPAKPVTAEDLNHLPWARTPRVRSARENAELTAVAHHLARPSGARERRRFGADDFDKRL
ncbi:hypothetical protein, partial [Rhizobium anhuiense]|uniref:hypothetical protein n=2 Tax=Rhizobium anhuiense TaxID=1184720 RepID=UPI001AEC9459